MQQKTPSKIKKIIFFGIIIIAFLSLFYAIIDSIIDTISLSRDYRYTISSAISFAIGSKRKYVFMVNGKWYSGFTSRGLYRDGTKYFIKYYSPNPWRNEATFIIADSTDIKNLPTDGYKELPHE